MPILAQSYQGIPGGMNQNVPTHEIPDTQASYMQDIILNTPGIVNRRGPLSKYSGSATLAFRATGIVSTQDPNGNYIVGVLAGDATLAYLNVYNASLSASTPLGFPGGFTFDPAVPRYLVDSKPMLGGGTLIGFANSLLASTTSKASLSIWKGGNNTINATGVTATIGSTAVTAGSAMFGSVVPGMFAITHSTGLYIGTVKSVTSTTALVLQQKALLGVAAGAIDFVSTIGVNPRAMKGRISIVPQSTTVRGTQGPQGTKFISQGLNSGTWNLYRLADDAWIGTVASVIDNVTLILGSINISGGMTNERYYAVKSLNVNTSDIIGGIPNTVGWLNTVWNGRQWYANRPLNAQSNDLSTRLWFSDEADPQGIDLSVDDGDFINIPSSSSVNTPIVAIQGIPAGLLVFKETELFMITGNDYTDFAVQKIADTGTLSTGSVQPAANGCIWAGRDGVLFFDGRSIKPLSAQLGDFWTQSIKGFNTATDRMGAFMWKNHYVLYIDNFASTFTIRKGAATTTPSTMTLVFNLDTFAVTTFTNVAIKDGQQMPAGSGLPTLAVVDNGGSPGVTSIIDTSKLLDAAATGNDTVTCGGQTTGPDFYLETKKYNMGDPERKKLFKQIAMTFLLTGDNMNMDTVPGLNLTGTAINTQWLTQATFANLRKKFTKRDTHMQFRFYQNSSAVTNVQIGPISIGFKLQRVGRV